MSTSTTPERVVATDSAVELLTKLSELHGGLMIHQSGGCCDGSAPMCYPVGEYRIGQRDVLLGEIVLPAPLPVVFLSLIHISEPTRPY